MAKYVLLLFDDDGAADSFVNVYSVREDAFSKVLPEVVGVYKKPTVFCDCIGSRKPPDGWRKGSKYGWWICTMCGKPSEEWSKRMLDMMGKNLLNE